MIAAADRNGYAGANVSQVIEHAGVSRPTFYDYFTDKDDCFLAVHRELRRLLVDEIRAALAQQPPEQAVQVAIRTLIGFSEERPDRASLLVNESMAAGWRGLDERDRLIAELATAIEEVRARAPADSLTPDIPIAVVLGAGRWLLAPPLRRGEHSLTALRDELIRWVEMYNAPTSTHRWHALEPSPELPPSPHVSEISLRPPPPIPPGRSRLSKSEIAQNQRERIMYATGEVAASRGYAETTIADITASAKVDRRVFYQHFRDKQQAFLAVHELGIQQLMAVSAGAFFSATSWPERVWAAMRAAAQFQATHPIIAHIALVESHAVGAPAIQRIDDSRAAFTIFQHEGNQLVSPPVSQTAMEAVGGGVFEICYRQARSTNREWMSQIAHNGTYLVLAPYIGVATANEFIDEKLCEAAATE